jgi:gamma-glutamylcyclotransferase (GGCT)/AIG2-like uncharacterized protein YtfP
MNLPSRATDQANIQHTRLERDGIPIFVYGTLRSGEINDLARAAANAGLPAPRHLGRSHVCGTLFDFGDWPGLLPHADGRQVLGDVYRVDEALLALMDEIEEYQPAGGSCFVRGPVRLCIDGRPLDCQYYPVDPAHLAGAVRTQATDWVAYRLARIRAQPSGSQQREDGAAMRPNQGKQA